MVNEHNYAVIMAGGIGSRFWPMSRTDNPKQFHDILGMGRTLIQMTYDRLRLLVPTENIYVVTNARYKDQVLSQLNEIGTEQVLCEPFMRNTAPCIAYANFVIARRDPDARIIVAPADHLITQEGVFTHTVQLALEETATSDNLVTLGIKPTRPDTGYGYIQFEEDSSTDDERIKSVRTFTEKPNHELAVDFLESGDFLWNSGIFVWSLRNIQTAFEKHLNDMFELFKAKAELFGTSREVETIAEIYGECENISIDYGLMEKANNVKVVLSSFGWSDLGTWGSLYTLLNKDLNGNAIVGDLVRPHQSENNIIYAPNKRLIVTQGLNGFIVVDTPDALLICLKEDEQKIKTIVNELKISKEERFV